MRISSTPLPDVFLIQTDPICDERGSFARTFCRQEFLNAGIDFTIEQSNTSFNIEAGTLRGMHIQTAPTEESKLVRCTTGRIFDVVIDLRKNSPTYCQWYGTELSQQNAQALFIPKGCAHGFLTLVPETEVLYFMGAPYDASCATGVRWDDPIFDIKWHCAPRVMSQRDAHWPDYIPHA